MDYILDWIKDFPKTKIIHSVIIIILSFLLYKLIMRFFLKSEQKSSIKKRLNNKSRTYIKLLKSIVRFIFITVTLLVVLQINGINVTSMLAGVGIASVVLGLAIQDALKDIIRGISIISDEYFSIGDVVTYNNITGKVISLDLKTTKIQDIATGNIISIANRNIEQAEVASNYLFVNIPMSYDIPVEKAEKIVNTISNKIKVLENIDDVEYKGVSELADSSIKYLLKITCSPENKLQVRRDCQRTILKIFEQNNISVPYNQIDVHQK